MCFLYFPGCCSVLIEKDSYQRGYQHEKIKSGRDFALSIGLVALGLLSIICTRENATWKSQRLGRKGIKF